MLVAVATVLIPIPDMDFDPTEVAVSWQVLTGRGHNVVFSTESGRPGAADDIMVSGRGLDVWSWVPGLRKVVVVGRFLRANRDARTAYAQMLESDEYQHPIAWTDTELDDADALLLPGGHRARGMRSYIDSAVLQNLVVEAFRRGKLVAANVTVCSLRPEPSTRRRAGRCSTAARPLRSRGNWSDARGNWPASRGSGIPTITAPIRSSRVNPSATCRCRRK